MNKLVNTVLSNLPKDVREIIHEYARDDTIKKEFIKTYTRLYFVWTSIVPLNYNTRSPTGKMIRLMSYRNEAVLSVKVYRNNNYYDDCCMKLVHFANVNVRTYYDDSFYLKSGLPDHYIWQFRFL